MSINPVHFAHGVCDEFLRYLFSAFPLSDPELAEQAKKLLERPSSLDIPLVQGPFVSLSEAFAKGDLVQKLADQGTLHHAMPGLIGYPSMWKHPQQVFEAVKKGSHVLVSTGTGSGKTEAFLYPIVDDLLRQRDKGITTGLTAILIYPMNALANDQLDRLRSGNAARLASAWPLAPHRTGPALATTATAPPSPKRRTRKTTTCG